ncbi:hypothetical protein Glove_220g52 [Diversispora epigaea]|uniref:Uncharacterized protein n=1 Tax=Diversispora epigaea TaxID=1348612 RepID=A0A397IFD5_9GLOM|nr:hypothetical protein Glove_220g52 [Diversispora epigaea]
MEEDKEIKEFGEIKETRKTEEMKEMGKTEELEESKELEEAASLNSTFKTLQLPVTGYLKIALNYWTNYHLIEKIKERHEDNTITIEHYTQIYNDNNNFKSPLNPCRNCDLLPNLTSKNNKGKTKNNHNYTIKINTNEHKTYTGQMEKNRTCYHLNLRQLRAKPNERQNTNNTDQNKIKLINYSTIQLEKIQNIKNKITQINITSLEAYTDGSCNTIKQLEEIIGHYKKKSIMGYGITPMWQFWQYKISLNLENGKSEKHIKTVIYSKLYLHAKLFWNPKIAILEKKNSKKIKSHTGILLNDLADQLAKSGYKNGNLSNIKPQFLNKISYINKINGKTLDIPTQDYIKELTEINHLINWKTKYRSMKTLSKFIILTVDWNLTQEILIYTKINDPETSEEDQKYKTFKIKLFIEELPTKKIMHDRYPQLYINSTYIRCNDYCETPIHALTYNNGIIKLKNKYLKIISKKLRKTYNDVKTKEIMQKEFGSHSDYQIDHNRTHNLNTEKSSNFSFVDIIRNLILNNLGKCGKCQQDNTRIYWCHPCNSKQFRNKFDKWTSLLNLFIKKKWYEFGKHVWSRNGKQDVCLKSLSNSTNKNDFLQEIKNQLKFRGKYSIAIYGITKNPTENEYMMVVNYAEYGSL